MHQHIDRLRVQRLVGETRADANGLDPIAADLANELNQPRRVESLVYSRISGERWVLCRRGCGRRFIPAQAGNTTPQSYRAHLHAARALEMTTDPDRQAELEKALLSKEQQAALARIKRYTDFNDLATQSRLGRTGVERQVKATVNKAVAEVKQKQQQRQQQAYQQRQQRTRHAVNI